MKTICVYCGSRAGNRPGYRQAAEAIAQEMARRGWSLVYGGGRIGLMGVAADELLRLGGRVVGVIPRFLADKELAHQGASEMHVVETMHERKNIMAELADGFVALPGGWGTLEEICEVVTWLQLSIHAKPCGLLNVEGFFDPLQAQWARMAEDDFLKPDHLRSIVVADSAGPLCDRLADWKPPTTFKSWVLPGDRPPQELI